MTKQRRPLRSRVIGHNWATPIGIQWFEPHEYARILEIMNYPPEMTRDYERWRELAEDHERFLKRHKRNLMIVRVVVHPDEFVAWCNASTVQPNSKSLRAFVQYRVTPERA
jgi:hypothetical protein